MKVKTVYILFLTEETDDEIKEEIFGVFSSREEAEEQGKGLVTLSENNYIGYHVSNIAYFD